MAERPPEGRGEAQEPPEGSGPPGPSEPVSEPPEDAGPGSDAPGRGEPTDELGRARREAAHRRLRIGELETERDELRGRLDAMQHAEVERLAGERLEDPADLFRNGLELETLLAEDGSLDSDKIGAALDNLLEQSPHYARRAPVDFGAGAGRGVRPQPTFGEALKSLRGR